jgi:hypothetical protein
LGVTNIHSSGWGWARFGLNSAVLDCWCLLLFLFVALACTHPMVPFPFLIIAMDALQALLAVGTSTSAAAPTSSRTSSSAAAGSTSSGAACPEQGDWCGYRPQPPGLKRRRLLSKVKAEPLESTPVKVKDEGADHEGDEQGLLSVVKFEEDAVGEKTQSQTCNGCARIKGSSVCFVNMDEFVQWPSGSSGRGLWCRDCHTTWRTYFSATHTLLFFSKWIRVERNFKDFEAALVAYLSIRAEGGQDRRVTSAMISERLKMLQWLSGFWAGR